MEKSFVAAWLFGRPAPMPPPGEDLDSLLDIAVALFARAQARCDEAGIPLTLALIIDGATVDAMEGKPELRQGTERIRQVLAATGGDVLDLVPQLEEMQRRTKGSRVMPLRHWNGEANRDIAGMIARHLAAKNPKFKKAN